MWLFGVKGSYSGGAVSDIRISAPPTVGSRSDIPSGATELSTWQNTVYNAVRDRKVLMFEVWLSTNSSSRKTYYVNFDN